MKVVVGSRDLWPTPGLASTILAIMATDEEQSWGVRASVDGEITSPTEDIVRRIALRLDHHCSVWRSVRASSGAFQRDNTMVGSSRQVYAFFAPGELMQGGTGHVVAVALRAGIPVTAYELDDDGEVIESASDEGDLLALAPFADGKEGYGTARL